MDYKKILRSLALGLGAVLVMAGVVYAATTVSGTLTLSDTRKIDFNVGGSSIYDDMHLRVSTDDFLYLDAHTVVVGKTGFAARTLDFNQGGSKIYEDMHLRIATDDNLYLVAPLTTYVSGALTVAGTLTAGGIVGDVTGTTSTSFTIASGSDTATTDVTLQVGGTHPKTFMWDSAGGYFAFNDDLRVNGAEIVTGTLGVTGTTTLTGTLVANGVITANANATFAEDVALGDGGDDVMTGTGSLTMTDAAVGSNESAVKGMGQLSTGVSSEGIGGYFQGDLMNTMTYSTKGCCGLAALAGWLNINDGATVTTEVWGTSFGVWSHATADLDASGDIAAANFGLYLGDTTAVGVPAGNVYMFRFNTDINGTTPTAWFRAANHQAVASTLVAGTYTTADGYIEISILGTTYRMPYYITVDE